LEVTVFVREKGIGMFFRKKATLPSRAEILPGRTNAMIPGMPHTIFHRPLVGPYPEGVEVAIFGLGCFWGAERKFWQIGDGIWITAVGYSGGLTPNPTYEEVCSGATGHNEVVLVAFNSVRIAYSDLLKVFWESHDPTQGMRQGNDIGTQYRSGIYVASPLQRAEAEASRKRYGDALAARGFGGITTEIIEAGPFYFAEEYHQQYLDKNPHGYCGLGGTGIACPIGLAPAG
jgi:peptide-methionine (S)-S-oxide reductase